MAKYKRNKEWDVKKGETLGGTQDHPKTFKSKVALDCYTDSKYGSNNYVKSGEDPNKEGTKVYGSAESAAKALSESLRKEPTGLERNEKKPVIEEIERGEKQFDESFSAFLRSKFSKY